MFAALFKGNKRSVLLKAGVMIAAIALLDWRIVGEIPLGFLYLLPMLAIGFVLSPAEICLFAVLCTLLSEVFDDLRWTLRTGLSRDVLYFVAFLGAGFYVRSVSLSRKAALQHLHEIESQRDARREAEEQLTILIESSPAAIVTTEADGRVLMANEAAHRLLGVPQKELQGRIIYRYLPSLTNVSRYEASQHFRTVMQARGQREDGETFLADICFSTYRTNAGSRLTAMVLDASEEFRTHEVSGLQQLLVGSRIAIGAVSHEIRNVSGAIGVVHQNLAHSGSLNGNKDFEALGNLVVALERIANVNLRQPSDQASVIDLAALLDELKIVVAPSLQEEEITSRWLTEAGLPLVWADRPSLMQVFLNLITNSVRALSKNSDRVLNVTAKYDGTQVVVEFSDNGGGVVRPEDLFRPFQAGAAATGLGLYLSRAFMRSFGGDLRYKPIPDGACFVVHLTPALSTGQE
ncbi:PAS domain S-box protein [Alloacidobacterium dinghuense]|uniref:histidine kinase n=1 Tax=Alloacidobacterium dinghuense TaxID=2763107 RepID=A0A7G8BCD3_9BACT|nr:PAS domain-containing sensor histidine kinase [Alloacidobacterium dinghuense]QNI30203.1 PAS domain S-box protein [Alloacidobacterium dinghuense]